ncbi:MAG: hypothetical protein WD151_12160 [Phycisphaeraceae bacterium]
MNSFTDSQGRTWTLTVTVDAIKRVRRLTEIDLLEAVSGRLLERLAGDPVVLCDVLYALCRPEAESKQVTDEDFGRAMAGDAIEQATAALLEALADFFPSRKRQLLKQAGAKLSELEAKVLDHAEAQLSSGAIDAELDRMLKASGDSPGSAPGSSDSTPGP